MINSFTIFKQDNQGNEKFPTHTLSAKIGDNYAQIGSGWTKTGQKGNFLSCQLNTENRAFKNKEGVDVNLQAYIMITGDEYKKLKDCEERCKFLTSPQEDGTVIDMARHPLNSHDEQKKNDEILDSIGF